MIAAIFVLGLVLLRGGGAAGLTIELIILAFTAITSAVIGYRMRREIKRALGRRATEEDLADLDTWMEVRDVEDNAAAEKPPYEKK